MTSSQLLHLVSPPYSAIRDPRTMFDPPGRGDPPGGKALVWYLQEPVSQDAFRLVRGRTPGVALIVVLPESDHIRRSGDIVSIVEHCRPQSILPHKMPIRADEIRALLSRPPSDLPMEITDYLLWRGLSIDLETRRLIRKTVELAGSVTTINGLSRALYLSRRALGRRFATRGLPVPSHWLHLARVLRSAIHLQDSAASLFSAATAFGYPDGFALSNQMHRLTGIRPSTARECLGWEWIFEAWLEQEAKGGGLSRATLQTLGYADSSTPTRAADPPSMSRPRASLTRSGVPTEAGSPSS